MRKTARRAAVLKAKQTPYASTCTRKCKTVAIPGRPLLSYEALNGVFEHLGQSNEHLQWRGEDLMVATTKCHAVSTSSCRWARQGGDQVPNKHAHGTVGISHATGRLPASLIHPAASGPLPHFSHRKPRRATARDVMVASVARTAGFSGRPFA